MIKIYTLPVDKTHSRYESICKAYNKIDFDNKRLGTDLRLYRIDCFNHY